MRETSASRRRSPNGTQAGNVTHEKFVKAWQSASSPAAVAEALGMTVKQAYSYAANLRRYGVELKKFHRHSVIDIDALNRIVAESSAVSDLGEKQ